MGFIKNIRSWSDLKFIVFLIAITSSLMVFAYFMYFGAYLHRPLGDVGDWGSFGSYMGSITGLLAFAGVLYTVKQSNTRANKAENESIKREERDIFFKLLELHKDKLNSITYGKNKGLSAVEDYATIFNNILIDYASYYCITKMSATELKNCNYIIEDNFNRAWKFGRPDLADYNSIDVLSPIAKKYVEENIDKIEFHKKEQMVKRDTLDLNNIYDSLIKKNQSNSSEEAYKAMVFAGNVLNGEFGHILGQYFKNMYYILDTCNNFKFNREYYFRLYRAQLSRSESLLCLINLFSDKSSEKFIQLLYENDMFDDLYYKDLFFTQNGDIWEENESFFVMDMYTCYMEKHPKI